MTNHKQITNKSQTNHKFWTIGKLVLVWITCCLVLVISAPAVLAQSPTAENQAESQTEPAEVPAEADEVLPEVKEKIKQRLEETVGDSIDKIKGLIKDNTNQVQKRAFAGDLEDITNDTLTIKTEADIKQASFSAETTLVKLPGRTEIEIDDLSVGDFVIAMGWLNASGVLETRRIVVSPKPKPAPVRKLLYGEIKEIDGQKVVFNGDEITLPSVKKLKVQGVDEPTLDDISPGDRIFVLATLDEDGEIDTINQVLVIPTKNGLEIVEAETPAEAEASPAAKTSDSADADSETEETEE